MKPRKTVQIYAVSPCPEGQKVRIWGAVLRFLDHRKPLTGSGIESSLPIALEGLIQAARTLKEPCHIQAYTTYAVHQGKSTLPPPLSQAVELAVMPHSLEWRQASENNPDLRAAAKAVCAVAEFTAEAWAKIQTTLDVGPENPEPTAKPDRKDPWRKQRG